MYKFLKSSVALTRGLWVLSGLFLIVAFSTLALAQTKSSGVAVKVVNAKKPAKADKADSEERIVASAGSNEFNVELAARKMLSEVKKPGLSFADQLNAVARFRDFIVLANEKMNQSQEPFFTLEQSIEVVTYRSVFAKWRLLDSTPLAWRREKCPDYRFELETMYTRVAEEDWPRALKNMAAVWEVLCQL